MKKGISKLCLSGLIVVLIVGFSHSLKAQNATDVFRYSLQYPSYDPVTMVMPGVAYATGFGAYQENPAVMAFFDRSFFSGGLNDTYVTEEGTYLNNTSTFDVNTLGVSHAGFLYKFPTKRGSLVLGGGYSLTSDYSRAISGAGFNELSTITDYYASFTPSNPLNEAAFSAYTIYDPPGTDHSKSILRIPDFPYQGITQNFELTETGTMGVYSAFIATELFKNLMVGVSIGVIVSNYEYSRSFLESDKRNLYEGLTVDSDSDGDFDTDIDQILSESTIEETATGFSARVGLVYQISPHINIGASYQFKNVLFIERTTSFNITTTLDNKVIYTGEILPTSYKYQVTRPARLNIGFVATNIYSFNFSAMIERVDYTSARIEFDELAASTDENTINSNIENKLDEVFNLRLGLEYMINNQFALRGGYGYYPSPVRDKNFDRQLVSGGFSAKINSSTTLNLGVQYATWEGETTLYSTSFGNEVVKEQINRWNIMAGLTYYF